MFLVQASAAGTLVIYTHVAQLLVRYSLSLTRPHWSIMCCVHGSKALKVPVMFNFMHFIPSLLYYELTIILTSSYTISYMYMLCKCFSRKVVYAYMTFLEKHL